MSMYGYLFRRLLGTIPVMLVVAVFIFLMLRLTPSDPAAIIAGDNATTEQVAQIRSQLGLDRPMIEQFFIWSGKVLTGDFGESFFFKKTVASLIGERIEPTLSLAFFTILIAVFVAVPLGVLAAHRHGSWIDRIVMGFSVLGFSVPVFVIGYLLIYLFAVYLNWLPVQGYQRISEGVGGWVQRLILPSVTLVGDLYRADRAHDPHQRAGSAVGRLYPHRAGQGTDPSARCCSAMRCAMRRFPSSP